jgi:hypothetical protein
MIARKQKRHCPNYAVYDGKNFIMMQLTYPYLIGFTDFSIGHTQREDDENISRTWHAARILSKMTQTEAFPNLRYHSDINIWRRTIPVLIRQAFQRSARKSGLEVSSDQLEKTGWQFGEKWLELQGLHL